MRLRSLRDHAILEWLEPINMTRKSRFGEELEYLLNSNMKSVPILILKNGQIDTSCIAEIIRICGDTRKINYLIELFKLTYLKNIKVCSNENCLCPYKI